MKTSEKAISFLRKGVGNELSGSQITIRSFADAIGEQNAESKPVYR
jgi:hypothetical protein